MNLDERRVAEIVERVVRDLMGDGQDGVGSDGLVHARSHQPAAGAPAPPGGRIGVFNTAEECVTAAEQAQAQLRRGGIELRRRVTDAMREAARRGAEAWARLARDETGMGRVSDKVLKNLAVANGTPGIEDLQLRTYKGDRGVQIIDGVPWGVICAITPSTNPTATVINNGIAMVTAGNGVIFCPHPSAKACTIQTMVDLNQAIVAAGGPPNLLCACAEPTLKNAAEIMKHPRIRVIAATGGPGVVRAASEAGKKFFAAGPGNPPVIVDATADLERAAEMTVKGASFDNNLPCVAEKLGVVESSVLAAFLAALPRYRAQVLDAAETERILPVALDGDHIRRESIGQDAAELLRRAGIAVQGDPLLVVVVLDFQHTLVQHEQMMPLLPLVRASSFEEALRLAKEAEHGFGHTAVLHSRDTDHITRFNDEIGTTLQVVNGPSYAWSGDEGEGYATMTVTTPTGEGVTSPRTWQRVRHLCYSGMLGR
ncbi:MAG: aldehyde dehydrogenase [Armatimonadetes bacterium]|nr:aldehyde dehydrogenase [Armatimonadota bacterium]